MSSQLIGFFGMKKPITCKIVDWAFFPTYNSNINLNEYRQSFLVDTWHLIIVVVRISFWQADKIFYIFIDLHCRYTCSFYLLFTLALKGFLNLNGLTPVWMRTVKTVCPLKKNLKFKHYFNVTFYLDRQCYIILVFLIGSIGSSTYISSTSYRSSYSNNS